MSDRGGCVFKTNVPFVLSTMERDGKKAAHAVGVIAKNVIVESFSGPRTGRWYAKPYTKTASYRASAPTERPAKPTGTLSGAVRFLVVTTAKEWAVFIGIAAATRGGKKLGFGIALELKTGPGRRPWLVPGMKDATPAIWAELNRKWF